jgi:hypothetical protein
MGNGLRTGGEGFFQPKDNANLQKEQKNSVNSKADFVSEVVEDID